MRAVAVAALILVLGACSRPAPPDVLAVGSCVVADDNGSRPVACGEPHTHKVIAIAARPEEYPRETDMFAQPADPDAGTRTACLRQDTTTK